MVHYSCDLCQRKLDPDEDIRYVVKIEISAAFDPSVGNEEDDRDDLEEIQSLLEQLERNDADRIGEDVHQELHFDLCPEMPATILQQPVGSRNHEASRFQQELRSRAPHIVRLQGQWFEVDSVASPIFRNPARVAREGGRGGC